MGVGRETTANRHRHVRWGLAYLMGVGRETTAYVDDQWSREQFKFPTSKGISDKFNIKDPESRAGKYARTLLGFAPAYLNPGSALKKTAEVVVPAVLSETAGQMTQGTKFEAPARMAAALVGGAIPTAVASGNARGGNVGRMLREDTRNVSDQQIADAMALRRRAPIQLSNAEAIQQVTGGGSNLGMRQRVVESTPAGQQIFGPAMATRPQEVDAAARAVFDQIAPATQAPSVLAQRASGAAERALIDTREAINAQARPYYKQLPGQTIPAQDFATIQALPSYAEAQAQLRGNPELNHSVASLPDNDLSVINQILQQLDAMKDQATPSPVNSGGNNTLAAIRGDARSTVDDIASRISSDWRMARDIGSAGRRDVLEPMKAGPVGQIARASDIQTQTGALYPNVPAEGTANETVQAIRALGPVGPKGPRSQNLGADLTRQSLVNAFNEATQATQAGLNQYGGANFAARVAGNPEQAAVLRAGVAEAAPNAAPALDTLLEALQATGQRQRQGSLTAYNAEALKEMGSAGVLGEAVKTVINPTGVPRRIGDASEAAIRIRNAKALAQALLSEPDQFQTQVMKARQPAFKAALKAVPPTSQAALIAAILANQ